MHERSTLVDNALFAAKAARKEGLLAGNCFEYCQGTED